MSVKDKYEIPEFKKIKKLSDFTEPLNLSVNDFLRKLDYSNKQFKNFRVLTRVEKRALMNIYRELSKISVPLHDLSDLLFQISVCKNEYDLDFLLTSFEAKA